MRGERREIGPELVRRVTRVSEVLAENGRLRTEIDRLRLTDAEREAIEVAARFMDKWGGVPNTIASDTLRGLLSRLGDCPASDNVAARDNDSV